MNSLQQHVAGLGSVVSFTDAGAGIEKTFQLVDPRDAEPSAGRLSIVSPVARALVGHGVGELVEARTPHGVRALMIGAVR
jgi:transcription elongation factor GreA